MLNKGEKKKTFLQQRATLRRRVYSFYRKKGRDLPWRFAKSAYAVFVSEFMLQQTQVSRVIPKYAEFIKRFPDFSRLHKATLQEVLGVWVGLGYNRRALMLHRSAEIIMREYGGDIPCDRILLEKLPGIGKGTSGALMAFIFNKPEVFIETNIRRVFIHHFFSSGRVTDAEIIAFIAKTIDKKNPRKWYYALMDYGAYLGTEEKNNPNTRSAVYKKQTPFKGSDREIRGFVMREFLRGNKISFARIARLYKTEKSRGEKIIAKMRREGLIS